MWYTKNRLSEAEEQMRLFGEVKLSKPRERSNEELRLELLEKYNITAANYFSKRKLVEM